MKKIFLLIVTILIIFSNQIHAEEKTVYVNITAVTEPNDLGLRIPVENNRVTIDTKYYLADKDSPIELVVEYRKIENCVIAPPQPPVANIPEGPRSAPEAPNPEPNPVIETPTLPVTGSNPQIVYIYAGLLFVSATTLILLARKNQKAMAIILVLGLVTAFYGTEAISAEVKEYTAVDGIVTIELEEKECYEIITVHVTSEADYGEPGSSNKI